jgi:hypothetical protein
MKTKEEKTYELENMKFFCSIIVILSADKLLIDFC